MKVELGQGTRKESGLASLSGSWSSWTSVEMVLGGVLVVQTVELSSSWMG